MIWRTWHELPISYFYDCWPDSLWFYDFCLLISTVQFQRVFNTSNYTLESTLLKMKSEITFQNVLLMGQNIRRGVWAPQTAAHIYRNLKLRIGQPKREMKVLFFLTVVSTFAAQGKKFFLNFDFYENLAETSLNDLSAHDQQRIHDYLNFFSQMVSYRRALEFLITPNTSLELGSILRQETADSKWSGRNLAQDRSQFQHGTSKDACFMTHESWGSLVKTIIVS